MFWAQLQIFVECDRAFITETADCRVFCKENREESETGDDKEVVHDGNLIKSIYLTFFLQLNFQSH